MRGKIDEILTRMNPNAQDELKERIQRMLDGEMQADEAALLDADLRACRESRALYLQLAALHSALLNQYTSRSANEPGRIISIDRLLSRQRQRLQQLAGLAAAAVLILAAIPLWLKLTSDPVSLATFQTTPDATYELIHSDQPDNTDEPVLRPGSRLKLISGRLEAKFSSGARCILEAPCELTALSGRHVHLNEGTAWFHVSPAAKGFEVETKHLHIVDLGTEFGVIAGTDGQDEIHVTQGSVEAAPRQQSGKPEPKQLLIAGQARRITKTGELIQIALRSSLFPTHLFKPFAIRNADFENLANPSSDNDVHGYGPIQDWATSGPGVGLNHVSQPFLNRPAHSGTHVAFIQGAGRISQTISGLNPLKFYTITYFVNERGLPGAATSTAASLDLGSSFYNHPDPIRKTDAFRRIVTGPLHVFGPTANIEIRGQTTQGDAALLIDSVSLSRAVPAIPDAGFETAVLPPSQFVQAIHPESLLLQASPWKFSQGAGILHNGSPFAAPSAPEGSQVAVLQNSGASLETTIHGFEPGVTYRLHFEAAGRNDGGGAAKLQFSLGGKPLHFESLETMHPPIGNFQTYTSTEFQASAPSLPLRIHSTSQGTTFLDDIRFEFIAESIEEESTRDH